MTTPMKESVSAWPNSDPAFSPDNSAPDNGAGVQRRIRVAFVEDDDDYREAVSNELGDHGFDVTAFGDGTALLASFADGAEAEIILLDWSLPSVSGIDLLPRLRRNGVALPVVFLTGRSQPAYEQLAFDRGALDFVDKARGVPILAHRLRLIADSVKKPSEPELVDNFHCGRLLLKPRISRAFFVEARLNSALPQPLAIPIAKRRVLKAVRICRQVLLVQKLERHAGAMPLAVDPRAIRFRTLSNRRRLAVEPRLELIVGERVDLLQRLHAGRRSSREHVPDRARTRADARRHFAVRPSKLPLLPQNLSRPVHAQTLRRHFGLPFSKAPRMPLSS